MGELEAKILVLAELVTNIQCGAYSARIIQIGLKAKSLNTLLTAASGGHEGGVSFEKMDRQAKGRKE